MKISKNEFFDFEETSNKINGHWKANKNGGSVKIYGFLEKDNNIHLTLATQTYAQWLFSSLLTVFTFGFVKDYFKNEKQIDCKCVANVEEIKQLITSSYQEMITLSPIARGVNEVALRLFNRLSQPPPKVDSAPPLTSVQASYAEKLSKATVETVKAVLTFFTNPKIREMSPEELKEVFRAAQENLPKSSDERTKKFLDRMMQPVNSMIDNLKGMKELFEKLARDSGDPDIRNKLVQSIAYGYIKTLMDEFDRDDVAIVNQMIQ